MKEVLFFIYYFKRLLLCSNMFAVQQKMMLYSTSQPSRWQVALARHWGRPVMHISHISGVEATGSGRSRAEDSEARAQVACLSNGARPGSRPRHPGLAKPKRHLWPYGNNGQWGPWRIGEWLTPILEDVDLLTCILNTIFVFVYVCILSLLWFSPPSFTHSSRTRRKFRSRYWASNKALIYFSSFFICVSLISVLVLCSLLSFIFCIFPRSLFLADKKGIAGGAGRPPSRGLHAPLVRLFSLVVSPLIVALDPHYLSVHCTE